MVELCLIIGAGKMTAHQFRRAPWLAGLAPILFLLALLAPAPLPASAAGGPPTPARHVPDGGVAEDEPPITYQVQSGDSLSTIARRFCTRVQALLQAHPIGATPHNLICPSLKIPV